MTGDACDHIHDHEWYRTDLSDDGAIDYLRCHECDREWQFERSNHTTAEEIELLKRQLREVGHELLQDVGLR